MAEKQISNTSWISSIRSLLKAPKFGDPAKDRLADLQQSVILGLSVASVLGVIINVVLSRSVTSSGMGVMAIEISLLVIAFYWQRRGYLERASWALVVALYAVFVLGVALSGLTFQIALVLTFSISLAGLLMQDNRVMAVTAFSIISLWVIPRIFPTEQEVGLTQLMYGSVLLGLEGLLLVVASRAMERSFAQARQSTQNLIDTNKDLQALTTSLEERVAERTKALSRQALQLQAATEVSRAASSELNVSELTQMAVNLVRDNFDLHYVGLFLIDEQQRFAILKAGTGKLGRQRIAAGHILEINTNSMIGESILHQKACVTQNINPDSIQFNNLLMPESRSELVLPLISRGQVIGAMTIQSKQESAFAPEDVSILQALADQLANGIEKARLYQQVQQRAVELDKARKEAESARIAAEEANRSLAAQIWQTNGQALLNEKMRGEQDIATLANNVIDQLCHYLDAQMGALYLLDKDLLKVAGTYAHQHTNLFKDLQIGEGLAGQAALKKRVIAVEFPEDYLPIASLSLEKIMPKCILFTPVLYNDQVVGVIELRKLTEFATAQKRFLEEAAESMAVAFTTAQARTRVDELLAQTRKQAEELRAQEEELRTTNEELEAQTESLRASKTKSTPHNHQS